MKAMTKTDGDLLARQIAGHVCKCRSPEHIILADDTKLDVKEEAKQTAQAYWMMGWTWDEIESILEDSEYTAAVVSYALKETKEYASKVLNEGPFAIFEDGQKIKLINGEIGSLASRYADHVSVQLDAAEGTVKVSEKQIDIEATKTLKKAFDFRREASVMIESLRAVSEGISMTASVSKSALVQCIVTGLSMLEDTKYATDSARSNLEEMRVQWDVDRTTWEADKTKHVAAIAGCGLFMCRELDELLHTLLRARLVAVHNAAVEEDSTECAELINYMQSTLPELLTVISEHIACLDKKGISTTHNSYVLSDIWKKSKLFADNWHDKHIAEVKRGINIADDYLNRKGIHEIGISVNAAMKQRGF